MKNQRSQALSDPMSELTGSGLFLIGEFNVSSTRFSRIAMFFLILIAIGAKERVMRFQVCTVIDEWRKEAWE